MSHRNSQYFALAGVVLLFVLYGLTSAKFFGPNTIGSTSNDTAAFIVPTSYAFSIWGPIYLGIIAFPLYQLIVNRNDHEDWKTVRTWFFANVVANGVWLVFASYDWQWLTVIVIIFMLYSLYRINALTRGIKATGATVNYWAEQLVFSLYFAWVTLATVLNVASALHFYDWDGFGISEINWTLIMSFVAAAIAAFVSRTYRDAAYAGVVVWAFVALAVKHWGTIPALGYAAAGIAGVFAILAATNLVSRLR